MTMHKDVKNVLDYLSLNIAMNIAINLCCYIIIIYPVMSWVINLVGSKIKSCFVVEPQSS